MNAPASRGQNGGENTHALVDGCVCVCEPTSAGVIRTRPNQSKKTPFLIHGVYIFADTNGQHNIAQRKRYVVIKLKPNMIQNQMCACAPLFVCGPSIGEMSMRRWGIN